MNLKAYARTLHNKPVAVFGIGRSNLAVIKALVAAGVPVVVGDDHADNMVQALAAGAQAGLMESDFTQYAALVLAPGVPLHFPTPHEVVQKARAAGIEIICDVEILSRLRHGRQTAAITGTNGKSTTTALLGHVLKTCHIDVAVGGNIGHAVLDLDMPAQDGAFVIEMSSYQIDLCPTFAPDIAVHLNLTPDHIDRHGDMEGYYQAKKNLFRGPGAAIIGVDDDFSARMHAEVQAAGTRSVFAVSVQKPVQQGVYVQEGVLYDAMFGAAEDGAEDGAQKVADLNMPALPGLHNQQNAAAVYAAARMMGLPAGKIIHAMHSFPGLAHRQYRLRTINDIAYVNDSKATNADATAKALACYHNIFWIVGGKPKEGGLEGLQPYLDRIAVAFTIGEAAAEFTAWLYERKVHVTRCDTLDQAVAAAHQAAQNANKNAGHGVVLLSPACASFDQFRDFEQRGDKFADLVNEL
ncbi:MAG TPA: UDP-N-acetylmuramoyl-L-alanine--D-glutamate ligase [Micavibrio sp.]